MTYHLRWNKVSGEKRFPKPMMQTVCGTQYYRNHLSIHVNEYFYMVENFVFHLVNQEKLLALKYVFGYDNWYIGSFNRLICYFQLATYIKLIWYASEYHIMMPHESACI